MSVTNINIPTAQSFLLVDTRTGPNKVLFLPAASTIQGRYLSIKDYYGNATASTVTISTSGLDRIDQRGIRYTLASSFGSVMLLSDGLRSWNMLGLYEGADTATAMVAGAAVAGSVSATGGTTTTSGSYKIHTFTTVGTTTFTLTSPASITAQVLVLAGGGGGGRWQGGGGGAGGAVFNSALTITAGTYNVIVGDGGAGDSGSTGINGANSSFNGLTGIGGGYGGAYPSPASGAAGGCGGGGAYAGGAGAGSQGFNGGTGTVGNGGIDAGGGGGMGGVGQPPTSGGTGGSGFTYTLGGTAFLVGGGGGAGQSAAGGSGGGGGGGNDSSPQNGFPGTPNTGGGGGGAGRGGAGGKGGSGIVIIAYSTAPDSTAQAYTLTVLPDVRYSFLSTNYSSGNVNNIGTASSTYGAASISGGTYTSASPGFITFTLGTGYIQAPSVTSIKTIIMIVRLTNTSMWSYLLDARGGLGSGYWASAIGPDWLNNSTYYRDSVQRAYVDGTSYQELNDNIWHHICLVYPTGFTDDVTFMARTSQNETVGGSCAEIMEFTVALTQQQIKDNFNFFASRFGWTPV